MQQYFEKTNEHSLLITSQPELESAFRNIIAELLSQMKEEDKTDQLVSRSEVTSRLHVDNSTLWRWDKTGYLKAVRIGRAVYYREADIKRLEEGRL